jgi:hypothetical protein
MTHTTDLPATENETWGFWGTMEDHAAEAWRLALPAIVQATGVSPEGARAFLDSRHSRHFADSVRGQMYDGASLALAIEAAIDQWMDWRIGRHTAKDYGIPRGLPYLTGFAIHCEICSTSPEPASHNTQAAAASAANESKLTPSASRCAARPVHSCQRRTITST